MKALALAGAIVAALAVAVGAGASTSGPEGPANCTFANGITTCAWPGAPASTQSTSAADVRTGCTTTTTTTTTTTSYTAHHGTYNSNGVAVKAPAATTSSTSSDSTSCPTHGSTPIEFVGPNYSNCGTYGQPSGPVAGTVYWYESGSNVHVHLDMVSAPGGKQYAFAARCRAWLDNQGNRTSLDGAATSDEWLYGFAGQTIQFDFETWNDGYGPNEYYYGSGSWYAVSPYVTL